MKLTIKEARNILENASGMTEYNTWIDYSICVGDSAGKLAEALYEKGYNLDTDKAITLGYVYDIGRMEGFSHRYVMRGYIPTDVKRICKGENVLNGSVAIRGTDCKIARSKTKIE